MRSNGIVTTWIALQHHLQLFEQQNERSGSQVSFLGRTFSYPKLHRFNVPLWQIYAERRLQAADEDLRRHRSRRRKSYDILDAQS